MSGALVPSSGAFPQQGQVDWMALSRSTVNVSLAMLARLSRSGIDPYIAQLGKVLCRNFQLAPRVQDSMEDSIKKLKKYGACTDLLWFGFGIKQVVTDLAETEEGLSLVALLSSLLTCFGTSFSATVLRELCLILGVPREFMPSLSQWRALLGVCSGILMGSQFELKMQGFHRLQASCIQNKPCDPTCIARVLSELSAVQLGRTAFLTVAGAADSSWVAAFAESILCLDIAILDDKGIVKYRSQDRIEDFPQVNFLTTHNTNESLRITMKTLFLVDSRLIHNNINAGARDEISLRSSWSTLIRDSFGTVAEDYLTGRFLPLLNLVYDLDVPRELWKNRQWATHILYVRDICRRLPWYHSIPKDEAFRDFAEATLPELKQLWATPFGHSESDIKYLMLESALDLKILLLPGTLHIYLSLLFGCEVDSDVSPSSFGLAYVRDWLLQLQTGTPSGNNKLIFTTDLVHNVFTRRTNQNFSTNTLKGVARSGRGICVYRQGSTDFQVDFEHIARFRICRGYIAYEDQRCMSIEDLPQQLEQSIWNREPILCTTRTKSWSVEALLRQHLSDQKLYMGFMIHSPGLHHIGQRVYMPLESTILDVCSSMIQFGCTCERSTDCLPEDPVKQHHIPMDVGRAALHAGNDQSSDVEIDCSKILLHNERRQISVRRSDMLKLQATMHSQRRQRPSFVFVKDLVGASVLENTVSYWYDIETLTLLWLHKSGEQDDRKGPRSIFLQACNRECVRCHLAKLAEEIGSMSCDSGAMTVYHGHSPYRESLHWECEDRRLG